MDKIIYVLFSLLVFILLISLLGFGIMTKYYMSKWWYLPKEDNKLYDPSTPFVSGVSHLVTALFLCGNLIPISIYDSIEIVKGSQAFFKNRDNSM